MPFLQIRWMSREGEPAQVRNQARAHPIPTPERSPRPPREPRESEARPGKGTGTRARQERARREPRARGASLGSLPAGPGQGSRHGGTRKAAPALPQAGSAEPPGRCRQHVSPPVPAVRPQSPPTTLRLPRPPFRLTKVPLRPAALLRPGLREGPAPPRLASPRPRGPRPSPSLPVYPQAVHVVAVPRHWLSSPVAAAALPIGALSTRGRPHPIGSAAVITQRDALRVLARRGTNEEGAQGQPAANSRARS